MYKQVIADHCCGYDMDIYQTEEEDGVWYLTFENERSDNDQIINYCPMCGKKLNEKYYDI